ncbi:hypothetical protein [uncultured Gimesia sp.]|uniref:hypothetical protein n=1 Tax=uncultured Gimesia sp. TaxID=1678688 RepID=UPI00261AC3EE|nr:hypothetical protein [uncultured Gimesia sp.]
MKGDLSAGNLAAGEFFRMGFGMYGIIDEVRVSTNQRYTDEFTPPLRHKPDVDSLALYHFFEGQGTMVRNASGNGHHGEIIGDAKWIRMG